GRYTTIGMCDLNKIVSRVGNGSGSGCGTVVPQGTGWVIVGYSKVYRHIITDTGIRSYCYRKRCNIYFYNIALTTRVRIATVSNKFYPSVCSSIGNNSKGSIVSKACPRKTVCTSEPSVADTSSGCCILQFYRSG